MKNRQGLFIVILVLMMVTSFSNVVPAQGEASEDLVFLEVRREATLVTFGVVTTDDTFTVLNNGTSNVLDAVVYYPEAFLELVTFRKAIDASETDLLLTIEETDSLEHFQAYKVTFSAPLTPGEQIQFKIRSEYHDLFFLRDPTFYLVETVQEFEMEYYWFPLVDAPILEGVSRVRARENIVFFDVPTNASFITDQTESYLEYTETDIAPLAYMPINVRWVDNLQTMLEYTLFERQMEIDTWGFVTVTEIHEIRNIGFFEQQAISIEYEMDMMNWSLYGEFGKYTLFQVGSGADPERPGTYLHSQQSEMSSHIFIIQLRYKLQNLDSYRFFFTYRIINF